MYTVVFLYVCSMKNLQRWLRLTVAAIMLISIVIRYNSGLELFELRWVEGGWCSWLIAPFAVRIVAFIEVLVLTILIFGNSRKNILVALGLHAFYLIELSLNSGNELSGHLPYFCFSNNFTSLVVWIISFALLLYASWLKEKLVWRLRTIWQSAVVLLGCSGVFVMNHLETKYFTFYKQPYEVGVSVWPPFFEQLKIEHPQFNEDATYLLPFFSTHCEVCIWNAMKIKAAKDYYNRNNIIAVFFEPEEEVMQFMKTTQLNIPYIIIPIERAFNLVGDGFPAFVFVEKGKVIKDLSPTQFNYSEIHQFFSR
jgi:hypothetical protein